MVFSARPPNVKVVMAESRHDEEAAIVDAIDGTTFRKSMVISLLLQLLESVREDVGDSGMQVNDSTTRPPDGDENRDQLKRASHIVKPDLDECLENELCKLWDASVNPVCQSILYNYYYYNNYNINYILYYIKMKYCLSLFLACVTISS